MVLSKDNASLERGLNLLLLFRLSSLFIACSPTYSLLGKGTSPLLSVSILSTFSGSKGSLCLLEGYYDTCPLLSLTAFFFLEPTLVRF